MTECVPAPGERSRFGDEPLRGAAAPRGDHQPLVPEPLVDEPHPVPFGADEVRPRDADVVEGEDRVVVGQGVRVGGRPHHPDPRRVHVHDEQCVGSGVGPARELGLEEHVVGEVGGRDVPLLPGEDVFVALPARRGFDGVHVGPRALLGDGVALHALAADGRLHPGLELMIGGHPRQPSRRGVHDPSQGVRHPSDLLLDQGLLEHGEAVPSELHRHVDGAEPELAGLSSMPLQDLGGQLAVRELGLDLPRDQFLVDEGTGPFLDGRVLRGHLASRPAVFHAHPRACRMADPARLTERSVYFRGHGRGKPVRRAPA